MVKDERFKIEIGTLNQTDICTYSSIVMLGLYNHFLLIHKWPPPPLT